MTGARQLDTFYLAGPPSALETYAFLWPVVLVGAISGGTWCVVKRYNQKRRRSLPGHHCLCTYILPVALPWLPLESTALLHPPDVWNLCLLSCRQLQLVWCAINAQCV